MEGKFMSYQLGMYSKLFVALPAFDEMLKFLL